jgi:hypothetical protein|tara:strand:- start:63 stop:503 length:441 start_codon:yes stop_codon:yes gene_type:complete
MRDVVSYVGSLRTAINEGMNDNTFLLKIDMEISNVRMLYSTVVHMQKIVKDEEHIAKLIEKAAPDLKKDIKIILDDLQILLELISELRKHIEIIKANIRKKGSKVNILAEKNFLDACNGLIEKFEEIANNFMVIASKSENKETFLE